MTAMASQIDLKVTIDDAGNAIISDQDGRKLAGVKGFCLETGIEMATIATIRVYCVYDGKKHILGRKKCTD